MADDDYPEKELTLHTVTIMPKYIDRLAKRFGISQEEAANELLLAIITCGIELDETQRLEAEPLATVVDKFAIEQEDDEDEPESCQTH